MGGQLKPNGSDLKAVLVYPLPPSHSFTATGKPFLDCFFLTSNHNLLSLTFPKGRIFILQGLDLPPCSWSLRIGPTLARPGTQLLPTVSVLVTLSGNLTQGPRLRVRAVPKMCPCFPEKAFPK